MFNCVLFSSISLEFEFFPDGGNIAVVENVSAILKSQGA